MRQEYIIDCCWRFFKNPGKTKIKLDDSSLVFSDRGELFPLDHIASVRLLDSQSKVISNLWKELRPRYPEEKILIFISPVLLFYFGICFIITFMCLIVNGKIWFGKGYFETLLATTIPYFVVRLLVRLRESHCKDGLSIIVKFDNGDLRLIRGLKSSKETIKKLYNDLNTAIANNQSGITVADLIKLT